MNLKMINIEFSKEEQHLETALSEFNRLCEEGNYPDILSWDNYKLYLKTNGVSPQTWKEFKFNPKIKAWFDEEQEMQLRNKVMGLINDLGDAKSTGQAQTLNALLTQIGKYDKNESKTKVIYQFVPLTEFEEQNPNVTILQTIPSEIRNAIQIIGPKTSNREEE